MTASQGLRLQSFPNSLFRPMRRPLVDGLSPMAPGLWPRHGPQLRQEAQQI